MRHTYMSSDNGLKMKSSFAPCPKVSPLLQFLRQLFKSRRTGKASASSNTLCILHHPCGPHSRHEGQLDQYRDSGMSTMTCDLAHPSGASTAHPTLARAICSDIRRAVLPQSHKHNATSLTPHRALAYRPPLLCKRGAPVHRERGLGALDCATRAETKRPNTAACQHNTADVVAFGDDCGGIWRRSPLWAQGRLQPP